MVENSTVVAGQAGQYKPRSPQAFGPIQPYMGIHQTYIQHEVMMTMQVMRIHIRLSRGAYSQHYISRLLSCCRQRLEPGVDPKMVVWKNRGPPKVYLLKICQCPILFGICRPRLGHRRSRSRRLEAQSEKIWLFFSMLCTSFDPPRKEQEQDSCNDHAIRWSILASFPDKGCPLRSGMTKAYWLFSFPSPTWKISDVPKGASTTNDYQLRSTGQLSTTLGEFQGHGSRF